MQKKASCLRKSVVHALGVKDCAVAAGKLEGDIHTLSNEKGCLQ